MKTMKKSLALLLSLLMLLSLCACGSSAARRADSAPEAPADDFEPMLTEEAEWEGTANGFSPAAYKSESADDASAGSGTTPEQDPEKIIYSSEVTVETTDFEASLAALDDLIKTYEGWVESSSVNGANYYDQSRGYKSARSAHYVLRIPSARFDELMEGLSALGNVPYTHTYTENVTAQYYDVQARLTAYKTQETRLLEMMEAAETVEDIILLEDRLTELRYEIESLQSSLNNWDRRVSYSTVNLTLDEVWTYTQEPETPVSYGRELWLALLDGLRGVGDFFRELLIFLVGALPVLLILGVLAAVLVPLVKKARARRAAKKEAKRAALFAQAKKDEEPKTE